MQPLQCTECGAKVLVEKNSWEHTSVQWNPAARTACREFSGENNGAARRAGAPRERCRTLTDEIEVAARLGSVTVLYPEPIRPLGLSH
ncbi:UNVERIFIED_CONTAM: hypothetical protein DES50_108170 [Williamsia faeni]